MHNVFRGGTPDMFYSGVRDMWIEWKWVPSLPKRGRTLIIPDLSALQTMWLNGRFWEGRNVNVVVGSKDGCIVFVVPHQWIEGIARDEARVQSEEQVAEWITNQCGSELLQ